MVRCVKVCIDIFDILAVSRGRKKVVNTIVIPSVVDKKASRTVLITGFVTRAGVVKNSSVKYESTKPYFYTALLG